ncbi:hypothetical protein [Thioclava sp. GXIMD2076]|uniref:DUF4169 family protein n=1 Tax=Thioclava kandeliae TaxID=3070818 RepID=A0ABV1SKN2_9RHOB
MAHDPKNPQNGSKDHRSAREDRLRAALRANLQRRKAQARGRKADPIETQTDGAGSHDAPPLDEQNEKDS